MTSRSIASRVAWLTAVACAAGQALAAEAIPEDFVYLRDVDPTILQDMRYAAAGNFTGQPVPGYEAGECILLRQAADALKKVQEEVSAKGLTLKVYDCYRPARAVAAFVDWAKAPDDPDAKAAYYPNLSKKALFPNYIATRSGHSRGATLDLTLVRADAATPGTEADKPQSCTAPQKGGAPDGSVAMGTTFDCFDAKANTAAPGLSQAERENRELLVEKMQAQGFVNYPMEWWHFTLKNEPYPEKYFDFPIVSRDHSSR